MHKTESGKRSEYRFQSCSVKTTMPILECILIDASTDVIKLTANDMELGIETSIDGEIIERGILALNAKIFAEIVRKLPDNEIIIDTQGDNQALSQVEKQNLKSHHFREMNFLIFRTLRKMIL